MRFGLFYEHQFPRPWSEGAEAQLISNALDQIELADGIGIDHVWEVEHHFLEEYSHSSAPEVFLAAASQRTKRIRLGHGIVQLPVAFNHPARVAERIAMLDIVSDGRVDFGTGEASSQMELGGFGIDREQKRAQWGEALDVIVRMFVEEPFAGHEGTYVSMPVRNVVPKPVQKPHPPLWVACSRRETILLAARKGLGALSFSFVEPEDAKEWVDEYYRIIESDECVPAGFEWNPNFAVVVPFMCHRDENTAIERGIDGGHFFGYSLAHYYVFGTHRPARTNVWDEFEEHRSKYGFAREIIAPTGEPLGMKLLEQGLGSMRGAVGTPEQITELIRRYESAGVDQVILVAQCGRNVHEHVCESLELFGAEVLPRFADDADAINEAKSERLADARAAALARREGPRSVEDDYVVTPDGEPAQARSLVLGAGAEDETGPEEEFLEQLRGRSDAELNSLVRDVPLLQLIFERMAADFQPQYARGFAGDIQYALRSDDGEHLWTVSVKEAGATAAEGKADQAQLTVRTTVPTFLRTVSGEDNAALATMQGRIALEGDVQLAMRLGEMFGRTRY
jgi:alkanesulfonate monooxygenase SsuD/methylene tetrahydromethanopterin reductase-like flavin-dependent oxidoreductase (luciferase family)/putative sterol carrier protein